MFSFFQERRRREQAAHDLYVAVVEQARRPEFYERMGVPDSVDGRFDLVVLHAFLVMRRLRAAGEGGKPLSQALFDLMFADMDQNLREMGVGDLSVGRKVKQMAKAFYGRVAAYEAALDDGARLEEALARNLYGTVDRPETGHVAAMARYLRAQHDHLASQPLETLSAGRVAFAPV